MLCCAFCAFCACEVTAGRGGRKEDTTRFTNKTKHCANERALRYRIRCLTKPYSTHTTHLYLSMDGILTPHREHMQENFEQRAAATRPAKTPETRNQKKLNLEKCVVSLPKRAQISKFLLCCLYLPACLPVCLACLPAVSRQPFAGA